MRIIAEYTVLLEKIKAPEKDWERHPVMLEDATLEERKEKILSRMRERHLKQIVVYGDVEHGSNFEYLVGFFTRFEESIFLLKDTGECSLVLGNENLNKASKARMKIEHTSHAPMFSLPNQPYEVKNTLVEQLKEAGLESNVATGVVGWKLFTSPYEDNAHLFDIPTFLFNAICEVVQKEQVINATEIFIGEDGARNTNNANELAHYEYGAALASDCMMSALDVIEEGVCELEIGDKLTRYGQHQSVVTIAASGERFQKGNMYPTDNRVKIGAPISLTIGYRGGLSSRAGYAVHDASELPEECKDYIDAVAAPYFNAYATWLSKLTIGMTGGELYEIVEEVLPSDIYGWGLCPGHLTAEEEWSASPIYKHSKETLKSGMILQVDIIPSVPGYAGSSAESTVALADETLRNEIKTQYPSFWKRIEKRRAYMKDTLGITLPEEVLPMCSSVAYLRPYMLDKESAFVWRKK